MNTSILKASLLAGQLRGAEEPGLRSPGAPGALLRCCGMIPVSPMALLGYGDNWQLSQNVLYQNDIENRLPVVEFVYNPQAGRLHPSCQIKIITMNEIIPIIAIISISKIMKVTTIHIENNRDECTSPASRRVHGQMTSIRCLCLQRLKKGANFERTR